MSRRTQACIPIHAIWCFIGTAALSINLRAQEHFRADDHAPIGVMGDHYHEAGELMLSYPLPRPVTRYSWLR